MEVSNIPQRGLNSSWRYEIFHGGVNQFTEDSNIPRRGLYISRRGQIFLEGGQIIHRGMKHYRNGDQ